MRLGESIQQYLRAMGVELALKPVDFPALIEAVRHPGVVPLFLLGWEADFPDPSNFLIVLLHSRSRGTNNNAFYANPTVDRLLDEAEPLLEPGRRLRLFHDAEVLIMRDAPWVPLFHPVGFAIRHPRVRNYLLHPLRPSRVETVWLAEGVTRRRVPSPPLPARPGPRTGTPARQAPCLGPTRRRIGQLS